MSHLKAKIKRPDFRKLRIFEFPFNFGDRISKEKNYGSSENWKFNSSKIFCKDLAKLISYLSLYFLKLDYNYFQGTPLGGCF